MSHCTNGNLLLGFVIVWRTMAGSVMNVPSTFIKGIEKNLATVTKIERCLTLVTDIQNTLNTVTLFDLGVQSGHRIRFCTVFCTYVATCALTVWTAWRRRDRVVVHVVRRRGFFANLTHISSWFGRTRSVQPSFPDVPNP